MLEQKLKLTEQSNTDFENENDHLKNLFHKLGVMYNQDDVIADAEYTDYDSVHNGIGKKKFDDSNNNVALPEVTNTKFRHAGHRDIQRIGGCPSAISVDDGHTIADKTRLYKLCEPIHKLPLCR